MSDEILSAIISAVVALAIGLPTAYWAARNLNLKLQEQAKVDAEARAAELEHTRQEAITVVTEALQGTIGELRETLEAQATQIRLLRGDLEAQYKLTAEQSEKRREIEEQLTDLSGQIVKANYAIGELEKTLSEQDRTIEKLRRRITTQERTISQLRGRIDDQRITIGEYAKAVELLTSQVVELGAEPNVSNDRLANTVDSDIESKLEAEKEH